MNYQEAAKQDLACVGGAGNGKNACHCAARLRSPPHRSEAGGVENHRRRHQPIWRRREESVWLWRSPSLLV